MLKSYNLHDLFNKLNLDIFNLTEDKKKNPFIKESPNKNFILDLKSTVFNEKDFSLLTMNLDEYLAIYSLPDSSSSFSIFHYDENNITDIRKSYVNIIDILFIIKPESVNYITKKVLDSIDSLMPFIIKHEDSNGDFCLKLYEQIRYFIREKKEFEILSYFLEDKKIKKRISDILYQSKESFNFYLNYNNSLIYMPFIVKSVSTYTLNKHIAYYLENNINFGEKPYSFGLNDYNIFRIDDSLLNSQALKYLSLLNIANLFKPVILEHKTAKNDFSFTRPNQNDLYKKGCFYLNIHELFLLKNNRYSSEMEKHGIFIRENIINDIVGHIKDRINNYNLLTELNKRSGTFINYDKEIKDIMKVSITLEKTLLNFIIKDEQVTENKKRL